MLKIKISPASRSSTTKPGCAIVKNMPWDYTKEEYEKQAKADPVWHLERLINHDFAEEKIDRALLEKHLPELHIPEDARAFLELILWNKY